MTSRTLTLTTQPRTQGHEILARLLEENERDAAWLASKVTFSKSHVWRVIHEGRRISPEFAEQLAAIFDRPMGEFLEGDAA